MRRLLRIALLAVAIVGGSLTGMAAWGESLGDVPKDPRMTELVAVMYGFNVAAQCGLMDGSLFDGYRRRVQVLILHHGLTQADLRRALMAADMAFELEYSDRGLGGYRNWCRTEGIDAAKNFIADRSLNLDRMPRPAESR